MTIYTTNTRECSNISIRFCSIALFIMLKDYQRQFFTLLNYVEKALAVKWIIKEKIIRRLFECRTVFSD